MLFLKIKYLIATWKNLNQIITTIIIQIILVVVVILVSKGEKNLYHRQKIKIKDITTIQEVPINQVIIITNQQYPKYY